MASQVAATTPDAGAVYEQAVRAVMARWTLLRLAVDQGWCDGDGAAAANGLVDDLVALAEDGSVEEIAKLVISLRNECAAGELGNALAAIARATQAPALAQCVSQGEPEENVDSDDDMDDAPPPRRRPLARCPLGASGSGGARAPPAPRPPPVVDEDGFTTVPAKGRRRK
ncbi:hypothetical protein JL720_14310 [Aureococcus anophagefferens]|nr:hypothetical protein JL720_14310 [Aureococcus anophagefferens]